MTATISSEEVEGPMLTVCSSPTQPAAPSHPPWTPRWGSRGQANLLVLLGTVGQQHPLGLHVPVEHTLQGRHVALDDVLHLREAHSAMSDGSRALGLTPCLGPPISGLPASQRHPDAGICALIEAHGNDGGETPQLAYGGSLGLWCTRAEQRGGSGGDSGA